jgi:predicted Rossmann fold nucleotide-binding protein DprA/Smf involved in DNA uptake
MILAVVGSRRMSPYGKRVIEKIAEWANKKNINLVTIDSSGCNRYLAKIGKNVEIVRGKNFYEMNQVLANKADKLIVVEGGENSGTILVAKEFADRNKDVWAVPGRLEDENSRACNFLLENGANIVTNLENIG